MTSSAGAAGSGQGFTLDRFQREAVAATEVYATARAWAKQFATGPAYALRAAKEAIDRGVETDLDTGLEIERQRFAGLFATEDRTIGMESFIESGPGKARFSGS